MVHGSAKGFEHCSVGGFVTCDLTNVRQILASLDVCRFVS